MKKGYGCRLASKLAVMFGILIISAAALAQGHGHGTGGEHQSWPDSLTTVSITGTVVVDSTFFHPQYFLDINSDDSTDYHLMFGPWWYEPESGATRPAGGDSVTIAGAETYTSGFSNLPGIIVFEINGQKWREPIAVGGHGWNEHGFWDMDGDTLTVSGKVFVDTTYFYPMYFLDTNGDSLAEYKLGFGPPWYEPVSGAVRPEEGDEVTVFGLTHETMANFEMLIVYRLNGLEWRPADGPAPWAGSWMHREHADSVFVYCVNDSSNLMGFAPGHMGSGGMGHGGMHWPDSVFVQFWQIYPDSLPGEHNPGHFQGFYINIHDPDGDTMMGGGMGGGHHGRLEFENEHLISFHYEDEELHRHHLDESALDVRYWDPSQQNWSSVANAQIDPNTNIIEITGNRLDTYYALFAPQMPTGVASTGVLPSQFKLLGNYPNPFNPQTTIAFELQKRGEVRLEIYSITGQRVATLLDGIMDQGQHRISWDGRSDDGGILASGIYLVQLQSGAQTASLYMTLLK